jgi:4-diphosphocytidyl-2-C-methyl-D-erythritol kinase
MPHMTAVLLMPPTPRVENKTRMLYSQLNVNHYTSGKITEEFVNMLEGSVTGQKSGVYNVFDSIGMRYFSGLREYRRQFSEAGAIDIHLAGSGPTLFTLLQDEVKAGEIQKKIQQQGLETCLASF